MGSWIRFGWARRTGALRPSLRLKLLLPVIGGAVLLIAIIGFIFISTYNDFVWRNRIEAGQRVDAARNGFLDKLQQANNIAQLIAKIPDLGDAIDARDQGVVAQIVEPFTRFTDLNFLTVYNRDLEVFARGDASAKFGSADELRPWLVTLVGQPSDQIHTAAALPYEGRPLLLAAEPIRTVNERFGGVAVAGFVIDDRFLAGIKQRTGADIIVAYDGRPIVATVDSQRLHAMGMSIRPLEFDPSTEGAGRLALSVALDEAPQRAAFWRRLATVIAILAITSIVVVGGADRQRRPCEPHLHQDRRRARSACRSVQPDGGPASSVVRRSGKKGRAAHPRARPVGGRVACARRGQPSRELDARARDRA